MTFRPRAIGRLLFLVCLCAGSAFAQRGPGGLLFTRYPFDQWAAENARPEIKWNVHIDPAYLSPHQRLVTRVRVLVEGNELKKRETKGPMLVFVRIEDQAGQRWQTGNQMSVAALKRGNGFLDLSFDVSAFMLPGDYMVSLAVCDAHSLRHSFLSRPLHVAPLIADPLPHAWETLPSVEFLPVMGPPDGWYLPLVRSRVALPVVTARPVHIDLLVNTTPSDLGSLSMFRQNMEVVVPAMKALTGIAPFMGSAALNVVDLNRRVITYEQPNLGAVSWRAMRHVFTDFNGASVDARTLAGQRRILDYLSSEAGRLLNPNGILADDAEHVLIVLSVPVYFTKQERPPVPDTTASPGRRVFYIRLAPPQPAVRRSVFDGPGVALLPEPLYPFQDDIERVLKPMGARVFRTGRPEDFRKALGVILEEIAKM